MRDDIEFRYVGDKTVQWRDAASGAILDESPKPTLEEIGVLARFSLWKDEFIGQWMTFDRFTDASTVRRGESDAQRYAHLGLSPVVSQ
jgi:hypothetical protein